VSFFTDTLNKAPWHPRVSGIYCVFFGPLAGGIISIINSHRLGRKRWGWPLLILSLIVSSVLWFILSRLTPEHISAAKYLLHTLAGAIFAILQLGDFENWKENFNGDPKPSNGWWAFGWGILGLGLTYLLMSVLASVFIAFT